MKMSKTLSSICALLLGFSLSLPTFAQQTVQADTTQQNRPVRGIQYSNDDALAALRAKPLPLFSGVSVSADLAGAILAVSTAYGQYEAACRVNLKGRYFPVVEVGMGVSDHTDETTSIHYKTRAPYFRIGCDYNFAKDLRSGNRIFGGLRYGHSSFDYDLDGPAIVDPVYGTSTPFAYSGLKGSSHWLDFVFGLEAKIWSFFHLGWSMRYRVPLSNKASEIGDAWYVPGYGRSGGGVLTGTFNVIFDI